MVMAAKPNRFRQRTFAKKCFQCGVRCEYKHALGGCCSLSCWSLYRATMGQLTPIGRNMRGAPQLTVEELAVVWLAEQERIVEEEATAVIYRLAAQLRKFRNDGSFQEPLK